MEQLMSSVSPVVLLVGVGLFALIGWLAATIWAARRIAVRDVELGGARERVRNLEAAAQDRDAQKNAFKSLATDALAQTTNQFLALATAKFGDLQTGATKDLEARQQAIDELLKPVRESLGKMDTTLKEIDARRVGTESGLRELITGVKATQEELKAETGNLVKALRATTVRGRWAEIQLHRVVEMAGMVAYCDFNEQESTTTEQGRLRPDMVVRLPAGRTIVVDSKAPLSAYLEALEAPDDLTRDARLADHARQVRDHIAKLAAKAYQEHVTPTPDFVVMFLPGESFFSAALQNDPSLIEFGVERNVIPATPTTLISLLRAVAYGWRQEKIAETARESTDLGRELHARVGKLAENFGKLGHSLDASVAAYNAAIGTLESRVLVSARRLRDLGAATGEEIPELEPVEKASRELKASPAGDTDINALVETGSPSPR